MKTKASAILIALFGLMMFCQKAYPVSPHPDGCYSNYTTAEGCNALNFLTTGAGNTGIGWYSLYVNSTGSFNTGVGAGALALNNGINNTATGAAALLLNTTGNNNTADGTNALVHNDSGINNTAAGSFALFNNTTGDFNTAAGNSALYSNVSGGFNTAIGTSALLFNNNGANNTATGIFALQNLGDGDANTALGEGAGLNLQTGSGNVYIGAGVFGEDGVSNSTYIRNINTTSVSGGETDTVTVNLTTGLLGHATSSRRYKEDIKPMNKASETLYRLNPVTYRYKKEIDRTHSPAFGLIAEEVAQVNPELVAHNAKGEPEAVHYEMINTMLLNEFLKEHRKVEEQDCRIQKQGAVIAELETGMKALGAALNQQATELRKVSAQVKTNGSSTQVIAGN